MWLHTTHWQLVRLRAIPLTSPRPNPLHKPLHILAQILAIPCFVSLQVSLALLESTGICRAVAQLRTHSNRDVAVSPWGGGGHR